jgi:hypothetical protein
MHNKRHLPVQFKIVFEDISQLHERVKTAIDMLSHHKINEVVTLRTYYFFPHISEDKAEQTAYPINEYSLPELNKAISTAIADKQWFSDQLILQYVTSKQHCMHEPMKAHVIIERR